ncbi:hypothetical protein [Flammeovirga kamogawensis]|uniref:WG repeat-containing protein n=1 Tax=Flammeovirga kamogawensis TaxID=373891 RepID=A0ABX8GZC7_9BACT|nr:hypothetical protein [Flammeovirga kamogawensis]MBB6459409.1 hypothetical protein [Flammeovirga kamogawensis]QWG08964.1 hypothetical protein KM029_08475 [Flammeovirga kamogawensis]TRX67254.1 hypothetical protein EO216_03520 [Flammeovirga kamogawensis]
MKNNFSGDSVKHNLKYLFLLFSIPTILGICSFSIFSRDWNGILLITKQGDEYLAFIDKLESTEDITIVSYINNNRNEYAINSLSDVIHLKFNKSDDGYIAVKKGKQIVSSVRLNHIQDMNTKQFNSRVQKAKDSAPVKQQEVVFVEPEPKKDQIKVVTVVEEEITVTEVPDEKIEEEKVKEEKATALAGISTYETFLVYNHYKHSVKNVEDIKSRDDLSKEIVKEATLLEESYEIENDYYSWLHLKDKKKGDHFAFDGEYLFEIDPKYFELKHSDKHLLKVYRDEHDIRVKPHNKKWMGIYYQDILVSEFKSANGYEFSKLDEDNFMINIEKHVYKVNCSRTYITIRKDGKIIEQFNTNSFKKEPAPVFPAN